ncbi:MAG: DUF1648 domain-containing protein [Ignavibacteriaceae bacterium]|nr:DUF1648 domain-containing protein [Ignavibacteriaceae bacterium]
MPIKAKEKRPVIKTDFTTMDIILLAVNILTLIFVWTYIVFVYNELSQNIPTHFGFDGKADATGPRSTLFLLPAIALGMSILLWAISFYPHTFNYAVKITEENAPYQYRLGVNLVRWTSVIICLLFTYITYITISTARGESGGFGGWFIPGFMGITTIMLIIYFVLSGRKK